jgi:hypothetical protein
VGFGPRRLDAVLDRVRHRPALSGAELETRRGAARAVTDTLDAATGGVARRDVVRAWCRSLPDGAPGPAVEDAADRLLETMAPDPGPGGVHHGPGVAERRLEPPGRTLGHPSLSATKVTAAVERAELTRLLAGRGIGLDRSSRRAPETGFGLG